MKTIPLVGAKGVGLNVIVDDNDYAAVSRYRWSLIVPNKKCPQGRYAQAWIRDLTGVPRRLTLHRFLLSPKSGELVDHINGDGLDNRRCNLRVVSHSQNQQNRRGIGGRIIKGVKKTPNGRWAAQIERNGIARYLGTYDTPEAASEAYQSAAKELFGEFAYRFQTT